LNRARSEWRVMEVLEVLVRETRAVEEAGWWMVLS
jgi:hypothetical protein